MSIRAGTWGILLAMFMLCAPTYAGDFSSYRGLQFGMDLAAATKQAGANPAEARLVHQGPALIQEIDWLPRPEAPQRELDKQKKREAEERLVLEKARSVNKPNFRP